MRRQGKNDFRQDKPGIERRADCERAVKTGRRRMIDLTRLAHELRRINGRCQSGGLIADCRIIEALSPALRDRTADDVRSDLKRKRGKLLQSRA
jgi:hypothetical protein